MTDIEFIELAVRRALAEERRERVQDPAVIRTCELIASAICDLLREREEDARK